MARKGNVIEHPITGEKVTFLQTAADTNGELLQLELAVRPHGFLATPHIHPHQEERFEILAGTFCFVVDGEERRVGRGATVTVPPGTPHAWWNAGDDEAVAIVEFRPALNMEEGFESAFGLAQDGHVDPVTGILEQPWLALLVRHYQDCGYPVEPPLPVLLEILAPIADEAERQGYRMPYPYPYTTQPQALAASATG